MSDGLELSGPDTVEVTVLATERVTAPVVIAVNPAEILSVRTSPIEIVGAGFHGFERVLLAGPMRTEVPAVAVGPMRAQATVPAGVQPGAYEVVVLAHGRSGETGQPRLRILAPREVSVPAGSDGLVRFGPEFDQDGQAPGTQLTLVLLGASTASGQTVRLSVTQFLPEGPGAAERQEVTATAASGTTRFASITVVDGATYDVTLDDLTTGARLARTVLTRDGPPLARAAFMRPVDSGPQVVALDASGSRAEAMPLLFRWTLEQGPVGAESLDSTAPVTFYTARRAGTYAFGLSASDGRGGLATAALRLEIGNIGPRAVIAPLDALLLPDARVPATQTGTELVLDGRGSSDANGDALSYLWTVLEKPSLSTFSSASRLLEAETAQSRMAFSTATANGARLDAGSYTVPLTVRDSLGLSDTTTARVRVLDPGSLMPVADPGTDTIVWATANPTHPGRLMATIRDPVSNSLVSHVRLDGRHSRDSNTPALGLTCQWSFAEVPAGSAVTSLTYPRSPTPRFVPDVDGLYRVRLVVDNGRYASDPAEVRVQVYFNMPPVAEIEPRLEFETWPQTPGMPFTVEAERDLVVLDGRGSVDPELDPLTYTWTRVRGPRVTLTPYAEGDPSVMTFYPIDLGLHVLALVVMDSHRMYSSSRPQNVYVIPPGFDAEMAVVAWQADRRGTDHADDDSSVGAGSLVGMTQVPVDLETYVTMTWHLAGTLGYGVEVTITQLDGSTVWLESLSFEPKRSQKQMSFRHLLGSGGQTRLVDRVRFTPVNADVYKFGVTARLVDRKEVDTGVELSRRIDVVGNSDDNWVPWSHARHAFHKAGVQPCGTVRLDGTASLDEGPNATSVLAYRWVQVEGPAVRLDDPYSPTPSFVVPDYPDDLTRDFAFKLFVEDGSSRSLPSLVSLQVTPNGTQAAGVPLNAGLSLVSPPVDPTWGAGCTVRHVLDRLGSSYAVALEQPTQETPARFRVLHSALGGLDRAVAGGDGLLAIQPRATQMKVSLLGRRWPAAVLRRPLTVGLNLVGYPRGVPVSETAEVLRSRAKASYVVDATTDSGGRSRFRICLPGLSGDFPIEEGKAYLLSVPRAGVLTFPTCGQRGLAAFRRTGYLSPTNLKETKW